MCVSQKNIHLFWGGYSPTPNQQAENDEFFFTLGIQGLRHELVRLEGETEDSSLGRIPGRLKHGDVYTPENQHFEPTNHQLKICKVSRLFLECQEKVISWSMVVAVDGFRDQKDLGVVNGVILLSQDASYIYHQYVMLMFTVYFPVYLPHNQSDCYIKRPTFEWFDIHM